MLVRLLCIDRWLLTCYQLAPEPPTGVMLNPFEDDDHDLGMWPPSEGSHGFMPPDEPAGSTIQDSEPNDLFVEEPSGRVDDWTWRCLACDSQECAWMINTWVCKTCSGKEFYRSNQPAKKVTQDGTWMFIPNAQHENAQTLTKSARRRLRRLNAGGPSGSSVDGGERDPEEESHTTDPVVEPSPRQSVRSQQRHSTPRTNPRHVSELRPSRSPENQLLDALRNLVSSKKHDDDWSSAAGPQKGVRWRGGAVPQPPVWRYDRDDLRAYSKFVKKVEIWKLQAAPFMSKKEMALALYNSLQGEAEQELEHTPIDEIHCDDGVSKILHALKGPMEQKLVYQKRRYLHEFENLRRYAGETMRQYINRFRRSQRCLRAIGVDVSLTYDDESMGARLLDRSGLSQEAQRLILVGTQQRLNFDLIVDTMLLQYPEFRGAPPVIGKDGAVASKGASKGARSTSSSTSSFSSSSSQPSTASSSYRGSNPNSSGKGHPRRQVHLTATNAAADTEPADEEFMDTIEEEPNDVEQDANDQAPDDQVDEEQAEDEDCDVNDLLQVLTLTAKRLSNQTLGRKFTNRPKPGQKSKLTPEDKPTTHCSVCGGVGHWYKDPECPRNGGSGGPAASSSGKKGAAKGAGSKGSSTHKVGIIHHDHGSLEIHEAPEDDYGNLFAVQMVGHNRFLVNEVNFNATDLFKGFMIIDTGCQRNCCGQAWLDSHLHVLKQHGLVPKMVKQHDEFQFGKGEPSVATDKAYLPSALLGVPLLLGTSVLPDQVPFLASNSCLTQLGAVINLVTDTVSFVRLGIETKLHRLGGHLAVNILDFKVHEPSQMTVWKHLSRPCVWKNPHPEFILSNQTLRPGQLLHHQTDAPSTAMLAAKVAPDDSLPQERLQEPRGTHDDGNSPPGFAKGSASSAAAQDSRPHDESSNLQPPSMPQVRKHARTIRSVPGMQSHLEVERRPSEMGGTWATRALFALATLATTIFKQYDVFRTIPEDPSTSSSFQTKDQITASSSSTIPEHQQWMDQFLNNGPDSGPFDTGGTGRGDFDFASGVTLGRGTSQHGSLRLPDRGGPQGRQRGDGKTSRSGQMGPFDCLGCHPGSRQRDLRLGRGILKSGNLKRLHGELRKSSKLLQLEHSVYMSSSTASDRPSPSADLWELFAGRALCTELASQHGLVALQPWDLIYGQDLMESSMRHEAMKVQKRFRPYLIMLGLDCKHYNRFNRNMNYSHRLDEWYELQSQDRPLLDLSADLAEVQHKHGRFFWFENPLNSEVWEQDRIQRLLTLPGVWSVVADAGAFGASIDEKPIAKPFRIIGNMPGLDEVLDKRLDADQRSHCVKIEGNMTRRSQEYPYDMCLAVVQHLRNYVQEQQPQRFCHTYQALPVQQPVEDLQQWNNIVEQIEVTYDRSSRRPYQIPTDTDLGRDIQNLLRIDASRIQVVSQPTTRRLPGLAEDYPSVRAAFLLFNDGSRSVEVEDIQDVQFPKQRFAKPVRIAIFVFGHRRQVPDHEVAMAPGVVPHMTTDIDFPGLTSSIPQEVRSAVARMHLNMGHPSRQELSRLLAYQGDVPDHVYECVRKLRCATCERLKPPQQPRPSTTPSFWIGQFGDELQMDIFHCRTLQGESFKVIGIVDKATGLHQAIAPTENSSSHMFDCFEQIWLRPFGLPMKILADPDPSFRGDFQERVQSLGCILELCPPEAHHVIGKVERRNAILRIILEKLIDQFAATTVDQCKLLLSSACHAMNSTIQTHGRSAYQAVFGRQPRLLNSNFNDPMNLATSPPVAQLQDDSYAFRAELVRAEAVKAIHDLDVSRHLRRALLRKTRVTKVADVLPGQKVAFWRWSRRGGKKRGTWITATFLSWDPSAVGKQAWIRSGGSSILVTSEQLRCAFGFEQWTPDSADIAALKDSTESFTKHMLDDRGPPPPDQPNLDDQLGTYDESQLDDLFPMTPSMMVPVTPPELLASQQTPTPQPHTPTLPLPSHTTPQRTEQTTTLQFQQNTEQVNIHVDSPTHITQQVIQQNQQYNSFGDMPRQARHRSRTPTASKRIRDSAAQLAEQQATQPAETPALLEHPATTEHDQNSHRSQASTPVQTSAVSQPTILEATPQQATEQQQASASTEQQTTAELPGPSSPQQPTTEVIDLESEQETPVLEDPYQQQDDRMKDPDAQLPQKRSFEQMTVLVPSGSFWVRQHFHNVAPDIGYGPPHTAYHYAYLATNQREEDVKGTNKDPNESDTTQDTDTEDDTKPSTTTMPAYKQGMTRQQVKALDREIPWRKILEMPQPYIDKFLQAIIKEADSWSSWNSVEPLTDKQASEVFSDPVLKKRVLKSRALYRDKSCGIGEIKPKCRVVALGHLDPDLETLTRTSSTPGRIAEHALFAMLVAGYNAELFDSFLQWTAWIGDAATAFLQGVQEKRHLPLYLLPPQDGLISQTSTWSSRLYRIRGNIYGLANAPYTWSTEVTRRLKSLAYVQHSFDPQLYYKVVNGQVVSIILVYVDDFIGISRSDYPLSEVHDLFKWGSLSNLEVNKPATFKGKELTLQKNLNGRFTMKITMEKFIAGLETGSIPRGRLLKEEKLSADEQKELRSVSGSLQWLATQARPEVAPVVSLTAHGDAATIHDLKALYATVAYLKETPKFGITMQDVPISSQTTVLAYSDSSWANASKSGSQIGVVVGFTTPSAKHEPAKFSIIDWKSARAVRVCRSTLAAEASAADEAADRSSYINMYLSEMVHLQPAHRVGMRLAFLQATDAKSLFDSVVSPNTMTNDKRTMVSIRAIQETVSSETIRWVPTRFQFSDGLTKIDEKLRLNFSKWLQNPVAILTEHPDNAKFEEEYFGQIAMHESRSTTKHQKTKTSVNFSLHHSMSFPP